MKYQDCTFENAVWKQLLEIKDEWNGCEMIGVLSSIAHTKINLSTIDHMVRNRTLWTYGYCNFNKPTPLTNDHPHLLTIMTDVCQKIGIAMPSTALLWNYWMCTPSLMVAFIKWFESTLKPTVLAHSLSMTNAQYASPSLTLDEIKQLCGVPYYPHVPFVFERLNKAFFIENTHSRIISSPLKHNNLFHKYYLNLVEKDTPIEYDVIQSILQTGKQICHLHIHNINLIDDYKYYIYNIILEYNLIITFNIGTIANLDSSITYLKVLNRGFDIGPKICVLHFIKTKKISYDYLLFLHSKTNLLLRKQMYDPLVKNFTRIKLISKLMTIQPTLMGIFPDWCFGNFNKQGILFSGKYEYDAYHSNNLYFNEILDYLNIKNRTKEFAAGNMMVLRKDVIDRIFNNNLEVFYNILNDIPSFDFNWFIHYNNLNKSISIKDAYDLYIHNSGPGNNLPIMNTDKSMPDAMIEHVFERIWLNVIKELNGSYLILDSTNIIDKYKIKLNAIYFPQFHEIAENNEFWGDKFTEWTLLKPYKDTVSIGEEELSIYKPHTDIGYYDLGEKSTLLKQIDIANNYGINGFIVYHYWFNKDKVLMTKPLEYFLDRTLTFPFSISWANESWTRRWDGGNNDMLLKQSYDDHLEHIQYLIPFFKMPNYIRNSLGECIFYIYNISFIPNFIGMMNLWITELKKHNLKIKIINTNNSFIENKRTTLPNDIFFFEPMNSGHIMTTTKYNNSSIFDYKHLQKYYLQYKGNTCHFGLPLSWNNCVRKTEFHIFKNFNMANLEDMLLILIAQNVLRYTNVLDIRVLHPYENFININAWNEWNEQAILEPNNITGYQTLETIRNIIREV